MRGIKDWTQLERHPLSAEYEDWSSDLRELVTEKIRKRGKWTGRGKITLHEGMVLDGWQRLQCCVVAGVQPPFDELGSDEDAREFVAMMNDDRRHETPEKIMARAAKRRERVAESVRQGKSERQIAKEQQVSSGQVHRDKVASGASGEAPEPPSGKVKGSDGKEYPASKSVFCPRCQRVGPIKGCEACKEVRGKINESPSKPPKAGKPKTAFQTFDREFGPIAQFPENVVKEYPHERGGEHYRKLAGLLDQVADAVKEWRQQIAKGRVA